MLRASTSMGFGPHSPPFAREYRYRLKLDQLRDQESSTLIRFASVSNQAKHATAMRVLDSFIFQ
jgi:hypothetical protein